MYLPHACLSGNAFCLLGDLASLNDSSVLYFLALCWHISACWAEYGLHLVTVVFQLVQATESRTSCKAGKS